MRATFQIFLLFTLMLLGVAGGTMFFSTTNPENSSLGTLLTGYVLLLVFAYSFFSLMGYFFRKVFGRKNERFHFLRTAKRQGLWLAMVAVAGLALQSQGLLTFWTAAPLVLLFVFIEYYAISR
jgi:hypothetical protein